MIDRVLSHYKVVSQIGQGGMGVVYKAWDEHLDRFVAIKILAPKRGSDSDRRRFVQEAKTASALSHPNIVVVHDVASDGATDFIVMEYVDGQPLKSLIPTGGMRMDDVLQLGAQIADAVAGAHEHGIIHRDLKPANILVTADQRAKVLDFGLAKSLPGPDSHDDTATMEGTVMGTAAYMSPEQMHGQTMSPASDVFSLGVILYEMLAGHRPFQGATSAAVMGSILFEEPAPVWEKRPEVPAELAQCVMNCLRKRVPDRTATAAEVRRVLQAAKADSTHSVTTAKAPVQHKPSIVVLPFTSRAAGEDNDYFGEGLAEEMINTLTRMPTLRVIARASAFALQGTGYDIAEIRAKLGVDFILDGVVRRSGDRVRVTVNLIQASDAFQLWSERFDRMMTDIFEIQDEISAAVAAKLKLQLAEKDAAARGSRTTSDIEAYKLYLKGRFYWNRRSWADLRRGVECFNEALEHDPLYADAYVGIADSYNLLGYYNERPPKQAYSQAKAAAEKALQIDPANSGAHASLGYATLFFDWDWAKAENEFRNSLERDPENPRAHHWHAWYYFATRQHAEGIAAMERAHDRDPLAPIVNDHLALSYSLAGRHDKALRQLRQTVSMAPEFFLAHYRIGWVHLQKGEPDEAVAPLGRAVELSGGLNALGMLGFACGLAGRTAEAEGVAARLKSESVSRYVSPLERALVCAGLSDLDGAFSWIEHALENRSSDLVLFLAYPWTEAMRKDPRFGTIARSIGLTQ
jgi:eukaryotic-like serine/threonine-protein kinase